MRPLRPSVRMPRREPPVTLEEKAYRGFRSRAVPNRLLPLSARMRDGPRDRVKGPVPAVILTPSANGYLETEKEKYRHATPLVSNC